MKPEVRMSESGGGDPRPDLVEGEVHFRLHDAAHVRLALAKWAMFRKWVERRLAEAADRHGVER